jgi:P-type E1-E2 ATPase
VKVFCKGAPEIVMEFCDKYFNQDGNPIELTPEAKNRILKDIVTNTFAKKAYRTLLIAYSKITKEEYEKLKNANNDFKTEKDREVLEQNLTIIGIYALQDPLRDEIVESVRKCHRAGINIRMVTGDNLDTAKAIAVEAGIVSQ